MTGMFSHRHNAGAVTRRMRQYQKRQTLIRFAEYLADTGDIQAAGKLTGVKPSYAKQLLREMRRELGWQAQ